MSDEENPQEVMSTEDAPSAGGLPDWAATSLVGLILAFGLTILIAQLRPGRAVLASPAPPLVSIADAAQAKSSMQQKGLHFVEGDDGLKLVPFSPGAAAPRAAIASAVPAVVPQTPMVPPEPEPVTTDDAPAVPLQTRAKIAIVIDDLGLKQNASLRATELPGPLTLAFLPYGENLQALSDNARAGGHEVIVHMPMQGADANDPGPHALLDGLPDAELAERLHWNLSRFTGFTGINNHMGSQFTENKAGMKLVLAELATRKLFYLDSRTTAKSAARQIAMEDKIPYAERDVFLDNTRDASYVALQLAEAEALAKRHGSAIAIGHPHDVTLETLARWIPTLKAKGIELVPVSVIIAERSTPMWRMAAYRTGEQGG